MRKNQRWASTSYAAQSYTSAAGHLGLAGSSARIRSRDEDDERGRGHTATSLMSGFMELKMRLRDVEGKLLATSLLNVCKVFTTSWSTDPSQLDAVALLHPFLEVIRSPETSGPITATALSSIDKFLTYSILSPASPNLSLAMAQLSTAGTHCKFEASDSVSDEVVLLKILDVLRNCLTGSLASVLSDESVCEMMETGLSMCCQMRLSGSYRSSI